MTLTAVTLLFAASLILAYLAGHGAGFAAGARRERDARGRYQRRS